MPNRKPADERSVATNYNQGEKPATKGYNIRKRSGKYYYKYIYKPLPGYIVEADVWGDTKLEVEAKIKALEYQNENHNNHGRK